MKKIISALTLGAMVAGAAFADVGVTTDSVQHSSLITMNMVKQTKHQKSCLQMHILDRVQTTSELVLAETSLLSQLQL